MSTKKMDPRCPLQLEEHPESFCPSAVLRLKAIRNAGKELTEREEATLPGCPYAVNHQLSNYCFFSYIDKYAKPGTLSDLEIASLLNISVDEVKRAEKAALSKMRISEPMQEIKQLYGDDRVVEDAPAEGDFHITKPR